MKWYYLFLLLGGCALAGLGTGFWKTRPAIQPPVSPDAIENRGIISARNISPCAIALAPHQGNEKIDIEIRRLQEEARSNSERAASMKRLGWAFITKARLSYDPGYYKLGEQCALCLRSKEDNDPDALLLQGHILQSLHRFKEAEPIARKLVMSRDMFTKSAAAIGQSKTPPFEFVVVDEAQDFGIAHLRFLSAIGASRPDALFCRRLGSTNL